MLKIDLCDNRMLPSVLAIPTAFGVRLAPNVDPATAVSAPLVRSIV
jgi:hypothetical protein